MREMPRVASVVLLVLAAVLASAGMATAHPPVHEPVAVVAPDALAPVVVALPLLTESISAVHVHAFPTSLVVILVVAAALAAWWPRRAIALALVLLLGVLAFEAALHSTHHLGEVDQVAQCVVAGVAVQLSADLIDTSLDARPTPILHVAVAMRTVPIVGDRHVAPDAGRAPPTLPA
jgi:hypothetical protein